MAAAHARGWVMRQFAFGDFEGFERNDDGGNVSATADLLAVAAMAFDHDQWLGVTFVTDRAADAAARDGKFHGQSVAQVWGKRNGDRLFRRHSCDG